MHLAFLRENKIAVVASYMLFNLFRGLLGENAISSIKAALQASRTVLPTHDFQMDVCTTQKYHVYKQRKRSPNQHKLPQYIYCT